MAESRVEDVIEELTVGVSLQTEISRQRLALEGGAVALTDLVQAWERLETCESLAYEDKVTIQLDLLQDVGSVLKLLDTMLALSCHMLKAHRQRLG
jgi:hypothetical protein